jgi:outer membrane immunogenic protein
MRSNRVWVALLLAGVFGAANGLAAEPPAALEPGAKDAWNGVYAGVAVSSGTARNDWTTSAPMPTIANVKLGADPSASFDASGSRYSILLGNNWRLGSRGVWGVEAALGDGERRSATRMMPGADITQGVTHFTTDVPTASVSTNWDFNLRARAGVLWSPQTLVYGAAGVAWQNRTLSASCVAGSICTIPHNDSVSQTTPGWTAGLGVEHNFLRGWRVRLEYRESDFGSFRHTFFTSGLVPGAQDDRYTAEVKTHVSEWSLGLIYGF